MCRSHPKVSNQKHDMLIKQDAGVQKFRYRPAVEVTTVFGFCAWDDQETSTEK
jgi:hypothetical protein